MFRIVPTDDGVSGEASGPWSADTDCEVGNVVPIDCAQPGNPDHIAHETSASESSLDQDASVMQMAFIQLMTQKVAEAVANCPEVLDQLNSNIRNDKR